MSNQPGFVDPFAQGLDLITEQLREQLRDMQATGIPCRRHLIAYIADLIDHAGKVLPGSDENLATCTETIVYVARKCLDQSGNISEAVSAANDLTEVVRNYLDPAWALYIAAQQLAKALDLRGSDSQGLVIASLILAAAEHAREAVSLVGCQGKDNEAWQAEGEWQMKHLHALVSAIRPPSNGMRSRNSLLAGI